MNASKDELLNVIRSWFKDSEKELIKKITTVLDKPINIKPVNKLRAIVKSEVKPSKPKSFSEESQASQSEPEALPKKRIRPAGKVSPHKVPSKRTHSESEDEQLYNPPPMSKKLRSEESEGNSSSPPKNTEEQTLPTTEDLPKPVEVSPIKEEPRSEPIQDVEMKEDDEKIFESENSDEDEVEELFKTESSSAEDEEEKQTPFVRNEETVNKLIEELKVSLKDHNKIRKTLEKLDKIFEKLDLDYFKILEKTGLPKLLRNIRKEFSESNMEFVDKMLKRWKEMEMLSNLRRIGDSLPDKLTNQLKQALIPLMDAVKEAQENSNHGEVKQKAKALLLKWKEKLDKLRSDSNVRQNSNNKPRQLTEAKLKSLLQQNKKIAEEEERSKKTTKTSEPSVFGLAKMKRRK